MLTKLGAFIVALVIILLIVVCNLSNVPAGYVGVKFNKFGSDKGVDIQEVGPGRYWVGFNQELYTFPTFTQTATWQRKGDDPGEQLAFQSSQGLTVTADVGITYHIDPSKVTTVFTTYRKGTDEITDIVLRNLVRDALVRESSKLAIESIYSTDKTKLIDAVQAYVAVETAKVGIIVDKVYWIGELRLPDNVMKSINATVSAAQIGQQREAEVAQATAQANMKIQEARGEAESTKLKAQAEADAIKLRGDALRNNPGIAELNAIERWDGHLPVYMLGNGATPFITVPTNK